MERANGSSGLSDLFLDAHGHLGARFADGREARDLVPVRCFPFAAPDEYVSIVGADGSEVAFVRRIDDLAGESRDVLAAELARHEFIPVVTRIVDVSPGSEPTTWHVETDRGDVRFVLPEEDHVRRLGARGALIVDEHGVRYFVPDRRSLDRKSRQILRAYL